MTLYYIRICRLPAFRPGHLASCSLLGETTGHGAQFRREWVDMNELNVHPFVDHFFENARISGG